VLWAAVDDGGSGTSATLARSSGAVTITDNTDSVSVNFPRSIVDCAWTATKGDTSFGVSPAGWAEVNGDGAAANRVVVRTRSTGGTADERDFHLVVVC
jgi:hypothetical protein